MQSCAKTDVGITRQMNQDYIFSTDTSIGVLPNLYIVADGMGGHNAGDFASRFCVETFTSLIRECKTTPASLITFVEECLRETNERLIVKAAESSDLDGMGTTFVAASVLEDNTLRVANIGDSRLYVIDSRFESIRQITEDHSLVSEMIRNGDIKKEEARFHPKKNIVTRAISANGVVIPDFFDLTLQPSDMFLMCSDGLSNMMDDSEILEIVKEKSASLEEACDALVEKANQNGGKDNISVVLVRV